MNVNNEMPKVYRTTVKVLSYVAFTIVGFVIGHSVKFSESVGSPDYEKSEIAKEITERLIEHDISLTDSSQLKVDSIKESYKGKKYFAKSISSVIYLEDGRKVVYTCTEDNDLLTLELIEGGEKVKLNLLGL